MDFIAEIKTRADIVQIVSAHVPLKKAGKDYKARCPFHSEKTPSFTVSAEKQLFYCFGCGTGGDVIRFVTLIDKVDTSEAIRRLADRLGIERPRHAGGPPPAEPLRRVMEMASRFFEAALGSPVGKDARAYLVRRKMPDAVAKKFRVGCAPARPDALTRRLMAKGVPEKMLIDLGLTAKDGRGGSMYRDRFYDRLMFPILDGGGRVVGFGGRVIREGDRRPKYLNSAENELFHKGKILYGYHTAKDMVSGQVPPVLVEGYLDVIYAQSAGLAAMAGLGTSLTEHQADLLARFGQPVLLAYDTDTPGRKATLRSAGMLLARDVMVGVLAIPGAKDPAEMVERGEADQLLESASRPGDAFKFIVESACALNPDTIPGRRAASAMVCELGRSIRDEILRQQLVRAYAEAFGIQAGDAMRMMRPSGRAGEPVSGERTETLLLGGAQSRLEWTVIGVAMSRPDLMPVAYAEIQDDFAEPAARMVWDALAAQYERRHEIDVDEVLAAFADNPAVVDQLTQMRVKPMVESNMSAKDFKDMIRRLRKARLKRQIDALHTKIKAAEQGGDKHEVKRLLDEDRELQKIWKDG